MSKKDLKLNPKIFDVPEKIERAPIRQGFGEGLLMAADNDKKVVALCADLTESTKMDLFKKEYPERFFEMGIAEQSMASVASGMAAMGKIPFISSYAMFSPGRNWEQIRTTICYNNMPVKIAGSHAGVSVGPDGGTHQAIEDIALARVIPNMVVLNPCDAVEAWKATLAAAQTDDPTYIRLTKHPTSIITTDETPFEIGRAEIFFRPEGDADVGVIASGHLVYNALRAAKELDEEGLRVCVMNLSTIKPLDVRSVVKLAKKTGKIVTVEEHQVAGGMGSAVAETLAEFHPVSMRFVGVKDTFGQSGESEELLAHHGMDIESIKNVIRELHAS
ncbi:MAG: transketolase family protein [Candidatus Pacebacteria bacterium]|nr:transketolase family protein [Candidatus Paceibacterota bacterium]